MKIGPVDSGDRPNRPIEEEQRRAKSNADAQQRMNRTDKVDISDAARSLSQRAEDTEETGEAQPTDHMENSRDIRDAEVRQEKIDRAKRKIESGEYDSPEVKKEIARRIADDFIG